MCSLTLILSSSAPVYLCIFLFISPSSSILILRFALSLFFSLPFPPSLSLFLSDPRSSSLFISTFFFSCTIHALTLSRSLSVSVSVYFTPPLIFFFPFLHTISVFPSICQIFSISCFFLWLSSSILPFSLSPSISDYLEHYLSVSLCISPTLSLRFPLSIYLSIYFSSSLTFSVYISICHYLDQGPKYFTKDTLTNRDERFFTGEIIRESVFSLYKVCAPITYITSILILSSITIRFPLLQ